MAPDPHDPNVNQPNQGGTYSAGGGPYGGGQYGGPAGGGGPGSGGGPYGRGAGGGPYHGPGGPHHPEKQDEKEQEKRQEKGGSMDEKYHRDPVRYFSWALLIIWVGVVLLLRNLDVLPKDDKGWGVFFWGGAAIIFAESLLRLANPRWRMPPYGSFIWGAVWLVVGFGLYFKNWDVVWPVIIIAVGVAILAGRLVRRR
jgi:hypothetical protein